MGLTMEGRGHTLVVDITHGIICPCVKNAPSTEMEGMIMVVRVSYCRCDVSFESPKWYVPCVCYIVVPTIWGARPLLVSRTGAYTYIYILYAHILLIINLKYT